MVHQYGVPGLDHLDDIGLGLRQGGSHHRIGGSPGHDGPARGALLVDEVEHTPVRETVDDELRRSAERRPALDRRIESHARPRQKIEPLLAVRGLGSRRARLGAQPVSFRAHLVLGGHVLEIALDIERLAVGAPHRRRVVSNPHDAPVPAHHPVLGVERHRRLVGTADLLSNTFVLVLVDEAEEETRLGEPVLDAEAEHRPDLLAHVGERVTVAEGVDIRSAGKLLDERLVPRVRLFTLDAHGHKPGDVTRDDDRR